MKIKKTTRVNELINKVIDQLSEVDGHFAKKGHLSYQDQYFVLRMEEILSSAERVVKELRIRQQEDGITAKGIKD